MSSMTFKILRRLIVVIAMFQTDMLISFAIIGCKMSLNSIGSFFQMGSNLSKRNGSIFLGFILTTYCCILSAQHNKDKVYQRLCLKAGADVDCHCQNGLYVNPWVGTCATKNANAKSFDRSSENSNTTQFIPVAEEQVNYVDKKLGIVFKPGDSFSVGSDWGDEIKEILFGRKVTERQRDESSYQEHPVGQLVDLMVNNASDFKRMAQGIANPCREYSKGEVMLAISCIVNSALATFKRFQWPDGYSFCRTHATLFRAAFEFLAIPRSKVIDIDGSTENAPHVVSKFLVTSQSGMVFSYVIDVGNYPSTIFPSNEASINWHRHHQEDEAFPSFSWNEPNFHFQNK